MTGPVCRICSRELGIFGGEIFCSRKCKATSQIKRAIVSCSGCHKCFEILPCYVRKTNYCSRGCYWNSTRKTVIKKCKACNKSFIAPNSLVVKGYGIYCSRECHNGSMRHKIATVCIHCNKQYLVYQSISYSKFCSKECKDTHSRDYVELTCTQCKNLFSIPRSNLNRGRGKFCSWDCFIKYKGQSSLEEKVEKLLKQIDIEYQTEVKFSRFRVDFLVPAYKLAIECDGEFWH